MTNEDGEPGPSGSDGLDSSSSPKPDGFPASLAMFHVERFTGPGGLLEGHAVALEDALIDLGDALNINALRLAHTFRLKVLDILGDMIRVCGDVHEEAGRPGWEELQAMGRPRRRTAGAQASLPTGDLSKALVKRVLAPQARLPRRGRTRMTRRGGRRAR